MPLAFLRYWNAGGSIMIIAIALFGSRVSPRFDYAQNFLLVEVKNGEVQNRKEISSNSWVFWERVAKLSDFGVDTLICGAIDKVSRQQLEFSGIKIYCWVTGEAEDALSCLLKDKLESGVMAGHGGCCHGHWRFRQGGGAAMGEEVRNNDDR
jgi:predicted Fe-Mo cluster-binding NifX family protein